MFRAFSKRNQFVTLLMLMCISFGSTGSCIAETGWTEFPWEHLLYAMPLREDSFSDDTAGNSQDSDQVTTLISTTTKSESLEENWSDRHTQDTSVDLSTLDIDEFNGPPTLASIAPLYSAPKLPGEGIWSSEGMPKATDGSPAIWRTSYRPSIDYPNAIVHMLTFDMSKLNMQLYIGSTEPGGSNSTASLEPELKPQLLAITNALWKQKHSGEAGAIYRGKVIKPLAHGMATIVRYNDNSVDILEWNESIPIELVKDARQLRHLIVKDGRIVDQVVKSGKSSDGEIGLGFLLVEEPTPQEQAWWGYYGGYQGGSQINYGENWFIATRSAFGIRKDGHLVFAAGHHISTKDLARALVLAGCDRAIHADANPHNVLGNLYLTGADGPVSKRIKLSPEQRDTLNRYDRSYTSDFFGFFAKKPERNS